MKEKLVSLYVAIVQVDVAILLDLHCRTVVCSDLNKDCQL